jgi:hypothetical protein
MQTVTTIGLEIAKSVFQVHGVDAGGQVVTSRRGERPDRWSWEIRRKSVPLGIKMTGDGFLSDTAAKFAGKRALADFLSDLSKAEKRPRK